jgi:dihydroorotate dehydrogenase
MLELHTKALRGCRKYSATYQLQRAVLWVWSPIGVGYPESTSGDSNPHFERVCNQFETFSHKNATTIRNTGSPNTKRLQNYLRKQSRG